MIAPSRPSVFHAAALAARPRSSAALVCSLAAVALAVSTAGCLVIEPPVYEHPEQTAPVLTAVSPPPYLPIHINGQDVLNFQAMVTSEDNGDRVEAILYGDYGRSSDVDSDAGSEGKRPYRRVSSAMSVAPGTIEGGQRSFTISWILATTPMPTDGATPEEKACHTITLAAAHEFDACPCPTDPNDTHSITWQIINCAPNDMDCPASCPALDCTTTPCLFCGDPEIQDGCVHP